MGEKVYPCPLCGRSINRKGSPFTDPSQTMAHIDGAHDDRHENEAGTDHSEEIRENADELDEAVGEIEPDGEHVATDQDTEPTVELEAIGEVPVSEGVRESFELASVAFEDSAPQSEIERLEERIDKQQEMIGELAELVEVLSIAVDANELALAKEVWSDEGSSVTPFDWEESAHEFKESRYE
ncbi:MAG: hypothetical protein ABEH81_16440 [Halopenitus sp.]